VHHLPSHRRSGKSLIELMIVMAIVGVLIALILPAVQASREAARRTHCTSNLRNQIAAVQAVGGATRRFPAGRERFGDREYSWCVPALPYLEQAALHDQIDRTKPWTDVARNLPLANLRLAVFLCPNVEGADGGRIDYAGVRGSIRLGALKRATGAYNGVLVESSERRRRQVTPGHITDGASRTIVVAECNDRALDAGGRWISGFNIISQDNGGVALAPGGEIYSLHAGGANVAFADGHTLFLSTAVEPKVVGALCTRNGGENLGLD
jgi:prepilin-type processing-associated H-X9-DG protein